jgi:hypothetical protein
MATPEAVPDPVQEQRRIWNFVSRFPLRSLWNLEGIPVRIIAKHTWNSLLDDNLVGRAAELGFFFIFALFPSLFTATSLLGLAARSASKIYASLLGYLAIVIPRAALGTVVCRAPTSGRSTKIAMALYGLEPMKVAWCASRRESSPVIR